MKAAREMNQHFLVVGEFGSSDDICSAITGVREKGYTDLESFSPFPDHALEEEMYRGRRRSPVRFFTFLGGLSGCLGAFLMTCWMSTDWPIRTSAKPINSIPAFVVIAFECTILLGGIFTLLSMFHFSKIPNLFSFPAYRPNFSNDRFGLSLRVSKDQVDDAKALLTKLGGKGVEVQYAR